MAITCTYQTATISTSEYSLPANTTVSVPTSQTSTGIIQVYADVANMVAGDQYELKLYEKCNTASTQRLVETWILTGAQARPMFVGPALILSQGWDFTAKRLAGSDRVIGWSVRTVA